MLVMVMKIGWRVWYHVCQAQRQAEIICRVEVSAPLRQNEDEMEG